MKPSPVTANCQYGRSCEKHGVIHDNTGDANNNVKEPDSIQWNGGIQSAHEVYAFIGKPFEPIWAMQTLVDGQPIYDPIMGMPVLHFTAQQGDMWLSPGDWIVKAEDDFKLVRGWGLT